MKQCGLSFYQDICWQYANIVLLKFSPRQQRTFLCFLCLLLKQLSSTRLVENVWNVFQNFCNWPWHLPVDHLFQGSHWYFDGLNKKTWKKIMEKVWKWLKTSSKQSPFVQLWLTLILSGQGSQLYSIHVLMEATSSIKAGTLCKCLFIF